MADRVVMGQHPYGWGLWISKPGYNVLTCTDDQMLFSMNGEFYRVLTQGTVTYSASQSGTTNVAISGSNGYVPLIQCYTVVQAANGTMVACANYQFFSFNLTSTNLAINLAQAVGAQLVVTYILFVNSLST